MLVSIWLLTIYPQEPVLIVMPEHADFQVHSCRFASVNRCFAFEFSMGAAWLQSAFRGDLLPSTQHKVRV
jgi:hypothetical protein